MYEYFQEKRISRRKFNREDEINGIRNPQFE